MELVGRKQTIKKKTELDFLAAFPAIVLWCIAKSKQVTSSHTDSPVSSARHHSSTLIHLAVSGTGLSPSLCLHIHRKRERGGDWILGGAR